MEASQTNGIYTILISYQEADMKKQWWHDKAAYQIYPKSFFDTNGDGIGDLKGITAKFDYLKALGIDIIWISPVYQSPFVDQGYDISDYYAIDSRFGTMEDFEELIREAKKRNLHILMDLVLNHCSDQHEWFKKALADPDGPYSKYFYFEKGKNGQPPCNWRSYFGGSVWEPVPGTDKYYLHLFAKEQPDLNWTNPELRQQLYNMINWWAQKGVDGFRIDAIINIKKDTSWQNFEPDGPDGLSSIHKMLDYVQGVGEYLEDLKEHTFALHDSFTVGEVFNAKPDELEEFIGDNGHFSTMFDFSTHCIGFGEHGWYDAPPFSFAAWRDVIHKSQLRCLHTGFLANIIENHDEPRGVSAYLPPHAQTEAGAKMLAACSVLLRGLPFLYQGQEIGMKNHRRTSIEYYDDISTKDQYAAALAAGLSPEAALDCCARFSRDNARTPVQWSAASNAGFTTGTPWQPVNSDYQERNVDAQLRDADSVLNFYRKLIALRKNPAWKDTFVYGGYIPAFTGTEDIFAFYRTPPATSTVSDTPAPDTDSPCTGTILTAANFGARPAELMLPSEPASLLLTNMKDTPYPVQGAKLYLNPAQVVVLAF